MVGPAELAQRHYAQGVRLRKQAERAAQAIWRRTIQARNLDWSWARMAPQLLAVLTLAQQRAAAEADAYADAVLTSLRLDADSAGRLNPGALTGVASDGRPLNGLLYSPITATKAAIGLGAPEKQALLSGLANLRMIVGTQVMDAGRLADSVALTARPKVPGYVRMLSVPSCPRCVILAGRFYRWSSGFLRHPLCDCRHIPSSEDAAGDLRTDPMAAFRAGKVTGLSKAERQAIQDGADLAKVINAHRGMYTAGGKRLTREGTKRGALRGQVRPTPEQLYRDATSREDAIRLLRRFGYII